MNVEYFAGERQEEHGGMGRSRACGDHGAEHEQTHGLDGFPDGQ